MGFLDLPLAEVEYMSEREKYKFFIKELLEGKIIKFMENLKPLALNTSFLLTLTGNIRVFNIIKTITDNKIDTKQKLLNIWRERPNFLKSEVMTWLTDEKKKQIDSYWSKIIVDCKEL